VTVRLRIDSVFHNNSFIVCSGQGHFSYF